MFLSCEGDSRVVSFKFLRVNDTKESEINITLLFTNPKSNLPTELEALKKYFELNCSFLSGHVNIHYSIHCYSTVWHSESHVDVLKQWRRLRRWMSHEGVY